MLVCKEIKKKRAIGSKMLTFYLNQCYCTPLLRALHWLPVANRMIVDF